MIENLEGEEWRDVVIPNGIDYTGFFMVSNKGRVKAVDRLVPYGDQTPHHRKEHIVEPHKNTLETYGRCRVSLCKDGKSKLYFVHRLVAYAFIPNPDNLPQINHKDENPLNNCVENLEWCTHMYNNMYGTKNQRVAEKLSRAIVQLDINGNLLKVWESTNEAGRAGYDISGISMCMSGKIRNHHGYKWDFLKNYRKKFPNIEYNEYYTKAVPLFSPDYKECMESKNKEREIPVVQLTLDNEFVKEYSSISSAAKENGWKAQCITEPLRKKNGTCHGYKFVYKTDYESGEFKKYKYKEKRVVQIDSTGIVIAIYNSVPEAQKETGTSESRIFYSMSSGEYVKGYKWIRYKDWKPLNSNQE